MLAGTLLVVMALFCALPSARAGSIEVIVNPDHSKAPIDRNLLRAIFTMRLRQWPDGEPIQVFVMPDGSELSNQFCREQLGTFPYVMRATWDRIVFTGTGLAPTVVSSEQEMLERVRSTPGAVGYIRSADRSELLPTAPNVLFASLGGY
jgi:ABC-type phosphate transport system substrate-binding protein